MMMLIMTIHKYLRNGDLISKKGFAESQKKHDELWNELQRNFKEQLQDSHEELSRKPNKGFIRVQKHMDTTISNVEDRLNDGI